MQSVSLVYLSSKRKKIINNFPITVITIFLSYARRSFSSAKSFGKQSHNWIGGNFHGDGTRELQNVSVIPLNIYFFVLFPFSSLITQSFLSTNAVEFMNESETIWFIISLENENFTHTDAELEAHGNRLKSWWWPIHIKTFNYRNYFEWKKLSSCSGRCLNSIPFISSLIAFFIHKNFMFLPWFSTRTSACFDRLHSQLFLELTNESHEMMMPIDVSRNILTLSPIGDLQRKWRGSRHHSACVW